MTLTGPNSAKDWMEETERRIADLQSRVRDLEEGKETKPITVRFERPCFSSTVPLSVGSCPGACCFGAWETCGHGAKSPHLAEYRGEAPNKYTEAAKKIDLSFLDDEAPKPTPGTCGTCRFKTDCQIWQSHEHNFGGGSADQTHSCTALTCWREAEDNLEAHTDQCRQHMKNIKTWMAPSFNSHCTDAMCIMDGKVREAKMEVERLKSALHDAEAIGDFPSELRDRLALKEHAELQEKLAKEAEARAEKAEARNKELEDRINCVKTCVACELTIRREERARERERVAKYLHEEHQGRWWGTCSCKWYW